MARMSEAEATRQELRKLYVVLARAIDLLKRLDSMTTMEFAQGGEREEREALRFALEATGWPTQVVQEALA